MRLIRAQGMARQGISTKELTRVQHGTKPGLLARLALAQYQPEGLTGPNFSYQRYVILGQQRTGSTMLVSSLRAHPHAWAYSELFNGHHPQFRTKGVPDDSLLLQVYRHLAPIDFIEAFTFRGHREDLHAIGFKVFPEHVRHRLFRPVWTWLQQVQGVKLIHIKRENKLDVYLSLVRAQLSGQWVADTPDGTPMGPVRLDPECCAKAFEQSETDDRFIENELPQTNMLILDYDLMVRQMDWHLERLQAHLGLEQRRISPDIHKQRRGALRDSIANYDELRERFCGTRWQKFFEM